MAPTNNAPLPNSPGPFPVQIPDQGTSSLWDRISTWASENKGVVYTVAGITLVAGAGGVIYYFSSEPGQDASTTASNKRKKQRERKRAKDRAEKDASAKEEAPSVATEPKKASVAAASEDELPEVDESTVGALSEDVCHMSSMHGDQFCNRIVTNKSSTATKRIRRQIEGSRQQGLWLKRLQPRH